MNSVRYSLPKNTLCKKMSKENAISAIKPNKPIIYQIFFGLKKTWCLNLEP